MNARRVQMFSTNEHNYYLGNCWQELLIVAIITELVT